MSRLSERDVCSKFTIEQDCIASKVEELMILFDRLKADLTMDGRRRSTLADYLIESSLVAA